jgi:hypothetical protein
MEEILAYRQELLAALEDDITRLARAEAGIKSQDWHHRLNGDQPSPHYNLACLWVEESQGYSVNIQRILDEDMPLLASFDTQTWMAVHYDPDVPAHLIIEDFATLRQWEVGLLCGLAPASWSRASRHPHWGVHTLQWWVEYQRDNSHQYISRLTALPDT